MSKQRTRAFKVTRLKLSEIAPDAKDRMEVEEAFLRFEAQRQVATEKHRIAVQNQAEAQQAQLEMQRLHQGLLLRVGKMSNDIANEPVWYAFRKNGDLVFESPYGERTQRNLVRAQLQQLDHQVRDHDDDDSDLFEEADDDQGGGNAAQA
jgi:uncharacterized protein YkuJ